MAALNGYFDCVQLLLDLGANFSAVTFHYGTSVNLIGKLTIFVIFFSFLLFTFVFGKLIIYPF